MKFTCSRPVLQAAVSNVSRAVSSKSAIPALEGILLKAKNSQIFICGYDLELGITTVVEADIAKKAMLFSAQNCLAILFVRCRMSLLPLKLTANTLRSSAAEIPSFRSSELQLRNIPICRAFRAVFLLRYPRQRSKA